AARISARPPGRISGSSASARRRLAISRPPRSNFLPPPMADATDNPTPRPRPRPHGWRRARRWLLGFLIVVVLLLLVVQILLWSDWPRKWVEAGIERSLGVEARIEGLVISWLGHTEVTAVSLTLPLADAPFARIDEMRVEHDWLPLLPMTRGVQEIIVHGVAVELREDDTGAWNVQRLGTGGDEPAGPRSAPGPIHDLPAVRIDGLSVDVVRPGIEPQRISNIAVSIQ